MQNNLPISHYSQQLRLLRLMWQKREDIRAYIGILLSLFAISFFGVFALRPTFVTIGELVSQIRTQQQTLELLNQKIKNLQEAQLTWKKIAPELVLLDQAIPEIPNPEIFARQIEIFAVREGVTVTNIAVGKVPLVGNTAAGLQFFEFSFTVEGETTNVLSLLNEFQTLRRSLKWESVIVTGKKTGTDVGTTKLALTVTGNLGYYSVGTR